MRKSTKAMKKKISAIGIVFGFLLALFTIVFLFMIFKLNVIPLKYFRLGMIVFIPIFVLLEVFLMIKSMKKKVKIPSMVISGIIMIVFGFGIYYMYHTLDFLGSIGASKYQIENFYVLVKSDTDYTELKDIIGKKVGIRDNKTDNLKSAVNKLEEEINVDYNKNDDIYELSNDLLIGDIDAMFISSSDKDSIEDENDNFADGTKIIYKVEIKTEKVDIVKDVNVASEPFNIYISGIDVEGDISTVSRSDVNMVVTVNPKTNQILMTSIPRDYYVQLHGTTGYKDKLTHSGTYGIDMTVQTVEDLLDTEINYYVRVNFTTLKNLVDAIGGIDVYSDYSFYLRHLGPNYRVNKGINHFDGLYALEYARERYAYTDGDRQRIKNQQDVLDAIITKTTSSKTILSKYTSILNSLESSFETNLDTSNITKLIKKQLNDMSGWNIEKISLNGSDASKYTYSYGEQYLYVMVPDESTVEAAKLRIDEVLNAK